MGTGLKIGDHIKAFRYQNSVWRIFYINKPSKRYRNEYHAEYVYGEPRFKLGDLAFNRDEITKITKKELEKHLEEII